MQVFYISDLHLRPNSSAQIERFIQFLKIPQKNDVLILGGDIFDLFVGDKKIFINCFSNIIQAVQDCSGRGVCAYYLEGNHDFHLSGVFANQKNFYLYTDDFHFQFGGKKFWISHGDLIDKEDYGYRFLRFVTRTTPIKGLIKVLPEGFFVKLGRWSSKQSRKYNSVEIMSEPRIDRTKLLFREFAQAKFEQGYDFVFIGHSHIYDQLLLELRGRRQEYLNLGFHAEKLLYAKYTFSGRGIEVQHL